MSHDATQHDGHHPRTDLPATAGLATRIGDVAMIVEWLDSAPLEFFGRYDIHEKQSARIITLPSAASGFAQAETVYQFTAGDDSPVLVIVPACGVEHADFVASEDLELIGLYDIHEKRSARRFTIPQCMRAFDETKEVYQFQSPEHHQSLLVAPV